MITAWYKRSTTVFKKNKIALVKSGQPYFSLLLKLINEASHSIHLQVYILESDETGTSVVNALVAAANRGVQVFVLADGYASQSLNDSLVEEMESAGIRFRFFNPILRSRNFYFGRRLHHKVFVTDAQHCLVGGINIGDRYNDVGETRAWLDFALHAEGAVAEALCKFCLKRWTRFEQHAASYDCKPGKKTATSGNEFTGEIRIRENDWVKNKNDISSSYKQLLRTAQEEVIICCSYFLPGVIIRKVFAATVRRGVTIKVIIAGKTDVPVSKYAERWLYDWMLRNNIELYEYQASVLHAKVGTCDDQWLTIGSYNMNQISAYASVELNLDVHNTDFVKDVKKQLQQVIEKDCVRITTENHLRAKNIFIQFGRWCAYQFIKIAISLFTFYFKRQ
ncbi:MAG TPA: phospholipase D-like domain-containing protein [Ferruginibacter sp.]|nr:phospholipase D-like domain-containing protein [Ferruginibacter sp.]HPH89491.1 phospholipase D-like domain-containing protein [Ferruginibacter sp.]